MVYSVSWVRAGGERTLAIGLHCWYYHIMITVNKKMVVPKKKRGRPFTGVDNRDPVTAIRLSGDFRAQVDAWAARQEDKPPRSEAIRRLVERGLAADAAKPASAAKPAAGAKAGSRGKARQGRA